MLPILWQPFEIRRDHFNQAAEQRSELSPRRGFASLGSATSKRSSPEGAMRSSSPGVPPITNHRCRPFGAQRFRGVDPRLAEPRLGLNSDRCSAALLNVHVSCRACKPDRHDGARYGCATTPNDYLEPRCVKYTNPDESVGYCHSSAAPTFEAKPLCYFSFRIPHAPQPEREVRRLHLSKGTNRS